MPSLSVGKATLFTVVASALCVVMAYLALTGTAQGASMKWVDLAISSPPSVTYRIPALAVTPDGGLLAVIDRRNKQSSDLPGDIDVLLRRSDDSGETWSNTRVIVDHPGPQGCGDSSLLVDRIKRRIFLFCTYSAGLVGFSNSKPGTADTTDPNTLHLHVRHSDDDGRTWSEPVDLNPQVKNPSWAGYFASSGHGAQLSRGRLIQPIVVRDGDRLVHSGNVISDDHGQTWRAGELLQAGTDESRVVELSNGRVMQNSRASKGGYRLVSLSRDGGETFSRARPTELIDPRVNADLIRVNPNRRGPHRNWLLFTNPASVAARENLTLRLSCDNGETWSEGRVLHSRAAGYSVMAMLPNGRVGIFAELGKADYTERLSFTSISIEELGAECD